MNAALTPTGLVVGFLVNFCAAHMLLGVSDLRSALFCGIFSALAAESMASVYEKSTIAHKVMLLANRRRKGCEGKWAE